MLGGLKQMVCMLPLKMQCYGVEYSRTMRRTYISVAQHFLNSQSIFNSIQTPFFEITRSAKRGKL